MEKEKLYKKWFKDTDRYNSDYVKNFIDENGKHIDIAWVQSGRGRGKSFDISAKALSDAWYSNGQKTFGYIRRYDKELTVVNIEQYFEDKKDFIKDMTNGECNRVVCKNKKIYLAKDFLDDNEKVKTELIMLVGYSFALNLANQYKSLQYPTIVTMIFEEVLSRSTYIQNEPMELLSLISTCRRDKELFTCFCITNTVSRVNPYSEAFGFDLRSLKEGQQTFTRLYSGEYDENKKIDEYYLISVEYLKAKDKMKKSTKKAEPVVLPLDQQSDFFNKNIELTVAKIVDVKPNPEGEKLYIETLDDGSGTPRTIQSGLRMYLKESDLLGKHVIIASNLAPRTMRGVESRGMLLAGDYKDADGKDCVEVLDASWAAPGTRVVLEGADVNAAKKEQITGDEFFAVQIAAKDGIVQIAGKKLLADGKEIKTEKALNSEIG